MGEKAAMACTVAVETVIVDHYNEQLRQIMDSPKPDQVSGYDNRIINELRYFFIVKNIFPGQIFSVEAHTYSVT